MIELLKTIIYCTVLGFVTCIGFAVAALLTKECMAQGHREYVSIEEFDKMWRGREWTRKN